MPLYEPTMPYRYVALLIGLLRDIDARAVDELLAGSGIQEPESPSGDSSILMSRFDHLLVSASSRLRRSDLGFELGRRITIDSHSTLGQALRRCTSLREMLLMIERYYHIVTPTFAARFVPGRMHCEWRLRVAAPMTQATLHMCLEMHAVSMHVDLLRLFGADTDVDIHLSAPPPPHLRRFRQLPRTRFHFASGALPEVRCVLPTALLDRPLRRPVGAPPAGAADVRAVPRPHVMASGRYGDWIELMLREAQFIHPTLEQLAGMLNMSLRTLARRLASEQVNFRELGARVRHERACKMLDDPRSQVHQVAHQLGYSDLTAFSRAFRRIGGVPPAAYRDRADAIGRKCQSGVPRIA